ncbi:hypothetical protein FQN57_001767 [Myotisia sp. PD_48]|nr:hypothetical protein FQN57_001767 [Myotisia sp. PD_48]
MKRFIGTISRQSGHTREKNVAGASDSPETTVLRELIAFCDKKNGDPGNDYIHLPAIVEAAESSPDAAKVAADQIYRYLSKVAQYPQRQYNSIMLIRILSDNPGASFTRNFDSRFIAAIKLLLRDGRDMTVQQLLRETLETMSINKTDDPHLADLIAMWNKEKEKFERVYGYKPFAPPPIQYQPAQQSPFAGQRQDYFARQHRSRTLPQPGELAARVHEANESSKLLNQMLISTPISEFYQNDMLKEFFNRCQSAAKSIQGYINATNPAPDEDTMLTLIETNDKLAIVLSRYNRAILDAKKAGVVNPEAQAIQQAQTLIPQTLIHGAQNQAPPLQERHQDAPKADEIVVSKKRFVPRLSFPRKPLRSAKQPTSPNPVTDVPPPTTPHNAPAPHLAGEVSPVAVSPPNVRPRPDTESPRALGALPAANEVPAAVPVVAPRTSWQYNPDEFQVENPFADKFSTGNNDDPPYNNRLSVVTSTALGTQGTTATASATTTDRYYSGAERDGFGNDPPSQAFGPGPDEYKPYKPDDTTDYNPHHTSK